MGKLNFCEEDVIEYNLELVKAYIMKACTTNNKEKIKKNLLVAQNGIERTLPLLKP